MRSGLGSSSFFTVGLLNTLYALRGRIRTKATLAAEATRIEQEVIGESERNHGLRAERRRGTGQLRARDRRLRPGRRNRRIRLRRGQACYRPLDPVLRSSLPNQDFDNPFAPPEPRRAARRSAPQPAVLRPAVWFRSRGTNRSRRYARRREVKNRSGPVHASFPRVQPAITSERRRYSSSASTEWGNIRPQGARDAAASAIGLL
jgi:hypothetical protein